MTKPVKTPRGIVKDSILWAVNKTREGLFDDDQLNELIDSALAQLEEYYKPNINLELLEACREASLLLTAGNMGQDKSLIKMLNKVIDNAKDYKPLEPIDEDRLLETILDIPTMGGIGRSPKSIARAICAKFGIKKEE